MWDYRSAQSQNAFTFIEFLIIVAIVAILGAIAVSNFLEVRTPAKVSRVRVDLRTPATVLKNHGADHAKCPLNNGHYRVLPIQIPTPSAYVTRSSLLGPPRSRMICAILIVNGTSSLPRSGGANSWSSLIAAITQNSFLLVLTISANRRRRSVMSMRAPFVSIRCASALSHSILSRICG